MWKNKINPTLLFIVLLLSLSTAFFYSETTNKEREDSINTTWIIHRVEVADGGDFSFSYPSVKFSKTVYNPLLFVTLENQEPTTLVRRPQIDSRDPDGFSLSYLVYPKTSEQFLSCIDSLNDHEIITINGLKIYKGRLKPSDGGGESGYFKTLCVDRPVYTLQLHLTGSDEILEGVMNSLRFN